MLKPEAKNGGSLSIGHPCSFQAKTQLFALSIQNQYHQRTNTVVCYYSSYFDGCSCLFDSFPSLFPFFYSLARPELHTVSSPSLSRGSDCPLSPRVFRDQFGSVQFSTKHHFLPLHTMRGLNILSGLVATTLFASSAFAVDLDPIIVKGSKFFFKSNGTQFFMRGIAYQRACPSKPSFCVWLINCRTSR